MTSMHCINCSTGDSVEFSGLYCSRKALSSSSHCVMFGNPTVTTFSMASSNSGLAISLISWTLI